MLNKRFCVVLSAIAALGAAALMSSGCDKGSTGLTKTEQQQLQNPPAPGSTPPPEARAAIQRMQSAPKGGPPAK